MLQQRGYDRVEGPMVVVVALVEKGKQCISVSPCNGSCLMVELEEQNVTN